jgi:hypothetical protein
MREHNENSQNTLIQKQLILFGLFRASPRSWRPFLYDKGHWNLAQKQENKETKKILIFCKYFSWNLINPDIIGGEIISFTTQCR